MRQITSIVQTSLDGFVAGPNREFDNFIGGEENLEFVCSLTEQADTALFGRISFELLDLHWPTAWNKPGATDNEIKYSNWYNKVQKIVFSKTLLPDTQGITVQQDVLESGIEKIKHSQGREILLFGSPTILHELQQLRLMDHIWIIIHPVLFGQGIRLFRETDHASRLFLQTSFQLSNGTLCNKYSFNSSHA